MLAFVACRNNSTIRMLYQPYNKVLLCLVFSANLKVGFGGLRSSSVSGFRELHLGHGDDEPASGDGEKDYDTEFAFTLAIIAGLSTVAGAFITFYTDTYNEGRMVTGLAVAAGVMNTAATELFSEAKSYFKDATSKEYQTLLTLLCFFAGILITLGLDRLCHKIGGGIGHIGAIPRSALKSRRPAAAAAAERSAPAPPPAAAVMELEDAPITKTKLNTTTDGTVDPAAAPSSSSTGKRRTSDALTELGEDVDSDEAQGQDINAKKGGEESPPAPRPATAAATQEAILVHQSKEEQEQEEEKRLVLSQLSFVTAVAIAIHNFSEGMAVFLAALSNRGLGWALCIGMMAHNIPEGVSIAIPVLFATGKRTKALQWTMCAAAAEPLGAVFAYLILVVALGSFGDVVYAILYAITSGMMAFIVFHELIPSAITYDRSAHHANFTCSIIAGVAIMHSALILFDVE